MYKQVQEYHQLARIPRLISAESIQITEDYFGLHAIIQVNYRNIYKTDQKNNRILKAAGLQNTSSDKSYQIDINRKRNYIVWSK